MKNILITFIFSLLSFGLMAEESINNNQDIKRNSFAIDFGMARNDVLLKAKYTGKDSGYTKY